MIFPDSQINSVLVSLSEMLKKRNGSDSPAHHNAAEILRGMFDLNNRLMCAPQYRDILTAIIAQEFHYPWIWKKIAENKNSRVGLLKIFSLMEIPLHDHPGSNGALLVLDGCTQVNKFQQGSQVVNGVNSFKNLSHLGEDVLHRHEMTIYTQTLGNIHGLKSLSSHCVLLCFQSPVCLKGNRSWYFSMGYGGSGTMYLSTSGLRNETRKISMFK